MPLTQASYSVKRALCWRVLVHDRICLMINCHSRVSIPLNPWSKSPSPFPLLPLPLPPIPSPQCPLLSTPPSTRFSVPFPGGLPLNPARGLGSAVSSAPPAGSLRDLVHLNALRWSLLLWFLGRPYVVTGGFIKCSWCFFSTPDLRGP